MGKQFRPIGLIREADERLEARIKMFAQPTHGDGPLKRELREVVANWSGYKTIIDAAAPEQPSDTFDDMPDTPQTFFLPASSLPGSSCLTPRHPENQPETGVGRYINRYTLAMGSATVLVLGGLAALGISMEHDGGPAPQHEPFMIYPLQNNGPVIDAGPAPEGAGPAEYQLPAGR
jgi:hypothetical protein